MTTSTTGSYTATLSADGTIAVCRISINRGSEVLRREISGNAMWASSNSHLDPVGATVIREVLANGTTSGTITVSIA